MPSDAPSDAADTRLAIAAFIARTKLDLTDTFSTMEQEVDGDPVIFEVRSKKALDQYLTNWRRRGGRGCTEAERGKTGGHFPEGIKSPRPQ